MTDFGEEVIRLRSLRNEADRQYLDAVYELVVAQVAEAETEAEQERALREETERQYQAKVEELSTVSAELEKAYADAQRLHEQIEEIHELHRKELAERRAEKTKAVSELEQAIADHRAALTRRDTAILAMHSPPRGMKTTSGRAPEFCAVCGPGQWPCQTRVMLTKSTTQGEVNE